MTRKTPHPAEGNEILDAVHETARDLRAGGLISKRRMKEYDALCLPEVRAYSSAEIRALRGNLSQAVFATVLNTSPSTVRQWESGAKHPSGPSRKLLQILEKKGLDALL